MAEIVHLSTFLHRPIFDSDGDRIGRVQDLVARLGDDSHPPIVGAVIRIEGRDLFVPIRKIGGLSEGRMTFEGNASTCADSSADPANCLLAEDLLARHLINLVRGRLSPPTRSRSPRTTTSGKWSASIPGKRPLFRRVLGKNVGPRQRPRRSWTSPPSSPSSRTSRRRDFASRTASSPSCTPPRSPTSSSRPATRRARRSSRPSAPTANSRPTSSKSWTHPPAGVPRVAQRRRRRASARAHGARQRGRPIYRDRPGPPPHRSSIDYRDIQKSKVRPISSPTTPTPRAA